MKEIVDPEHIDTVKSFISSNTGSNITLDNGKVVILLKGDIKERSDEAILIFRYQLIS